MEGRVPNMRRLYRFLQSIWVYLVAVLLQGIVPNLLTDWIRAHLTLYFIGATALVLILLGWVVRRMRRFRGIRVTTAPVQPRRGLIVLVSAGPPPTAAEEAIRAHLERLEYCWLIVGPGEGEGSPRENAERIIREYSQHNGRQIHFEQRYLENPNDLEAVYYLVQSIYTEARAYKLSEADLIADYTGGTKSMTAGMVLACATREDRDMQYMKPRALTSDGRADPSQGADPVLVDLKFLHPWSPPSPREAEGGTPHGG
jgi:hypothetical protein